MRHMAIISFRGVAENIIATALVGVGGLMLGVLAVWLASLTPIIRQFAPLSYLYAALLAILLASIVAYVGVRAWRPFNPLPPREAEPAGVSAVDRHSPPVDEAALDAVFDDLKNRIVLVDATYAGHVAGLDARLQKLEQPGTAEYLAYERWLDIQQEHIERIARDAKDSLLRAMGIVRSGGRSLSNPPDIALDNAAASATQAVNKITSSLLGKSYDFSGRPRFDKNPHREVPGDEEIDDPARKHDFRRGHYDVQQIDSELEKVKRDFGSERSKVHNLMIQTGQALEGKLR